MRTGADQLHQVGARRRGTCRGVMWWWRASQPPRASTADLAERGDRLQGRRCSGPAAARAGRGSRRGRSADVGEAGELAVLLAEALDDPHAGDGLVDDAGDLAGLLLGVPGRREHAWCAASAPRPGAAGMATRATSVSSGDSHSMTDEATRRACTTLPSMIGRKASSPWIRPTSEMARRHELAGLQLVVAGEVEALQPLEDRVAQVVLDVEADPAADEPADVGRDEARRPRPARAAPATGRGADRGG